MGLTGGLRLFLDVRSLGLMMRLAAMRERGLRRKQPREADHEKREADRVHALIVAALVGSDYPMRAASVRPRMDRRRPYLL